MKKMIEQLTKNILRAGLRPFVAKSGNYGFFTDMKGSRVVSFQAKFDGIHYSGNYETDNPGITGTGWVIGDKDGLDHNFFALYETIPPRWAVCNSVWHMTSLIEHIGHYGNSSDYTEVLN